MNDTYPAYTDGLQAVSDLAVNCLNTGANYICYDGDPSEDAAQKEFSNADMNPLGSWTATGFRKGTLNLQYTLASDELPGAANEVRPGFIMLFRGRYYVAGGVKNKIVKNDVIKFSVAVTQVINPIVSGALSVLGQQKAVTANALSNYTLSCAAVNARTGSTVTYAVGTFPTGAAPGGITINTASGVLTANVAAGSYDIMVTVSDVVAGKNTNYGFGRVTLTAA
jgi:hypothetical protein